jgi:hypothetical protein
VRIGAPLDVVEAGRNPDQGGTGIDRYDMRDHLADSGADEIVLSNGRHKLLLAQDSALGLKFSGLLLCFQFMLRSERVDRDGEVVNAVFDKPFVFKTELDFGDFFVAVAATRIDLAVEVELDSLFRFAGSEKPEGGCSERQQGSDAAATCTQLLIGSSGNSRNMPTPPMHPPRPFGT